MAVATQEYGTGSVTRLIDVGTLAYNGVTFSPLFETNLRGVAVKDRANRTVMYSEYLLTADGYVTLLGNQTNTDSVMQALATRLQQQGQELTYVGRGFDFRINAARGPGKFGAGVQSDVAWGPIPELLDFQTMGAGRSARVKWQIKFRVAHGGPERIQFLQLNYESTASYGEDGYSNLSLRGTMEIPLTRSRAQSGRQVATTVDQQRRRLEDRILAGIDLSRFRITKRDFNVSRDKRILEWSVDAEEKPYMDLPPACTIARGNFNCRPARAGMGLANWLCTLRITYTVRRDAARRIAWVHFLAMLRLRMNQSTLQGAVPDLAGPQNVGPPRPGIAAAGAPAAGAAAQISTGDDPEGWGNIFFTARNNAAAQRAAEQKAWLTDFHFDEGLYLDSKTITFSATWRLSCRLSHILQASGLWKKLPETDAQNRNLWALSMQNVQGSSSWLTNRLDPTADVIVDFGGP